MIIKMHRKVSKFLEGCKNQELLHLFEQKIFDLSKQRIVGIPLKNPFNQRNLKKIGIKYGGNQWRLVYTIDGGVLYIVAIGSRQNFYDDIDPKIVKQFLS